MTDIEDIVGGIYLDIGFMRQDYGVSPTAIYVTRDLSVRLMKFVNEHGQHIWDYNHKSPSKFTLLGLPVYSILTVPSDDKQFRVVIE